MFMPRTTDRFTISLPPAMNTEVERVMAEEDRPDQN